MHFIHSSSWKFRLYYWAYTKLNDWALYCYEKYWEVLKNEQKRIIRGTEK